MVEVLRSRPAPHRGTSLSSIDQVFLELLAKWRVKERADAEGGPDARRARERGLEVVLLDGVDARAEGLRPAVVGAEAE